MDIIRAARKQVLDLIDAAYDSGWYAGAIEKGGCSYNQEHSKSINERFAARKKIEQSLDMIEQKLEVLSMNKSQVERTLSSYETLWDDAVNLYPELEKLKAL